jgi:MFS family permease
MTSTERLDLRERWSILALAILTNALVAAAPAMAMPVLFDEISSDLQLSLVQVGLVWGIGALPGLVAGLLAGALGDRFGSTRVLSVGCLLIGLTGLLRGLAVDFLSLTAAMFLAGMMVPFVPLNTLKTCGQWFSRRQWGLASGMLSMGMALGFLLGSLLSATVLSPWLGGWRQVLTLYGIISALFCLPWWFIRSAPRAPAGMPAANAPIPMRSAIWAVFGIRNILLSGFTLLGFSGCIQGVLGYLPLYLRQLGWHPALADGALASFHTISLFFSIPIALLSDRMGSRKKVLIAAALMTICSLGFLSFAQGILIWAAILAAGIVRDGFMAVFMASVIETEGVGTTLAGTATGLMMVFSSVGNLFSPPLGNALAEIYPGLPFLFWAFLAGLGLLSLLQVQEKRVSPALVV